MQEVCDITTGDNVDPVGKGISRVGWISHSFGLCSIDIKIKWIDSFLSA